MIQVLVGDYGHIDFLTPVEMSADQREKFLKFLSQLFSPVEVEETNAFRANRLGSKEIHPKWTAKEFKVLLDVEDHIVTAETLGRSPMSVIMMYGGIAPALITWCHEHGIDFGGVTVDDIARYLKEKELENVQRRKSKKEYNKRDKEIAELENDLLSVDSERERDRVNLLINMGKIKGVTADEYFAQKKDVLRKDIQLLKKLQHVTS